MSNFSIPRPHFAGIFAALTSIFGVVASPAILGVLPAKWAAVVTGVGIIVQAVTKPVHAGDTDIVPKP